VSTTERNLQKKNNLHQICGEKIFFLSNESSAKRGYIKKIPHHFVNSEGMEYQTIILYRMIRTASAAALALARISSVDSSKEPYANATPMRRY